jgi:hypothetical protein
VDEKVTTMVELARQAVAMLQEQALNVATVGSMAVRPFLSPYRATADLIAEADDAKVAEASVVAMAVP